MRVNGELITNVTSYAWTVPSLPCSTPLYVEAVYGTNWYVDAVNGNNGNNGSYPNVARKTLESVLTNAISGDVVTAAPGTYSEGSMLHAPILAGSSVLPSRAVVPAGVTLRSSAGAESTFIVGASASSPTDEFGNGSDAVRGVVLEADARLCGEDGLIITLRTPMKVTATAAAVSIVRRMTVPSSRTASSPTTRLCVAAAGIKGLIPAAE
jgi:hypothetical protein